MPLVLFHFEDMSYDGIASLLRVSVGKVKTDMFNYTFGHPKSSKEKEKTAV